MSKTWLRRRRVMASALVLLNLVGARIVRAQAPCEKCRTIFAPSRGFRALAKLVTGQDFSRKPPKALGAHKNHVHADDVDTLRQGGVSPVSGASFVVTIGLSASAPARALSRRLPSDKDPTRSPHLQAKK